jgi:hypothetical protein
VDHALGVGVPDGLADRLEHVHEPREFVCRVGPAAEVFVQRAAADELHGQERGTVGVGAEVVDGGDAGVRQPAGDPGLADEPGGGFSRVAGGEKNFNRHLSAEGEVGGGEHPAHAAAADLADYLIPGQLDHPGRPRAGRPAVDAGRVVDGVRRVGGRTGPGGRVAGGIAVDRRGSGAGYGGIVGHQTVPWRRLPDPKHGGRGPTTDPRTTRGRTRSGS